MSSESKKIKRRHERLIRRSLSEIPPEVVDLIFKRLLLLDQLRFGSVCKSWLSILSNPSNPVCDDSLTPEPFLLLRGDNSYLNTILISLSENRVYKIPYLPSSLKLKGSSQGYLFYAEQDRENQYQTRLRIIDPFANARKIKDCIHGRWFMVPFQSHMIAKTLMFYCQEISALMLAVISSKGVLSVCQFGTSIWGFPTNRRQDHYYMDVVYHKRKLYAITKAGKIHVFGSFIKNRGSIVLNMVESMLLPWTYIGTNTFKSLYLVESSRTGNLMVVIKQSCTSVFEVFKLDLDRFSVLEGVDSLGDEALFLGDSSSFSLSVQNVTRLDGDHIYSAGSSLCYGNDFGFFRLGGRNLRPLFPSLPFAYSSHEPIWITSTLTTACLR